MLELFLILGGSVAIASLVVNRLQLHFIRRELQKPFPGIPPALAQTWSKSRLWSFSSENSVTGAAAGVNTAQALYHLSQIDGQVLAAIDKIYDPQRINSYRQLVTHLSVKHDNGESTWEGAVNNYKGRVGEDYLAEHLRADGHDVVIAESTSQEGWDAIVDGTPVNFKAGLGTDHIQEHLVRYPNIPIITVAEHAEAFSSVPQVTCLEGVSGVQIAKATNTTMESVVDLSDFGFDLPMITVAVSSVRNFAPVFRGKSDLGTAIRYTAADTAGVGFGVASGSKVGAAIGVFSGPLGAAAGAILGGFMGAVGGRWFAKKFKETDLRGAIEELNDCTAQLGCAYIGGLSVKAEALDKAALRLKPKFSLVHLVLPTPGDVIRKDVSEAYINWAEACRRHSQALLGKATREGDTKPSFLQVGKRILSGPQIETVYNPGIQERLSQIKAVMAKIDLEKVKLGHKRDTKASTPTITNN